MKKYLLQVSLATLLVILGIATYYQLKQRPAEPMAISEFTNKVQGDVFAKATGQWDAQIKVLPFLPQQIEGQEVGSATGIRLEWVAPAQEFNHFLMTVTQPESGWKRTESREHDGVSLDVTALLPDTKYVFDLQACADPRCAAWMIATEEIAIRTGKVYLQATDDVIDPNASTTTKQDAMSEDIRPDALVFLNTDGSRMSDDEKNQLTLGAVLIDTKTNQFYVQVSRDKELSLVRLLNP